MLIPHSSQKNKIVTRGILEKRVNMRGRTSIATSVMAMTLLFVIVFNTALLPPQTLPEVDD